MKQLLGIFGGARRDRTDDLLTASQALSQLSYSPKIRLGRKVETSLTGFILSVNKKQYNLYPCSPYMLLMKMRFVMF